MLSGVSLASKGSNRTTGLEGGRVEFISPSVAEVGLVAETKLNKRLFKPHLPGVLDAADPINSCEFGGDPLVIAFMT